MAEQTPIKLDGSELAEFEATDTIPPGNLGTGTPSASNYLRGDGAWAAVGGGGGLGDVVGPASSTDNALPRFDGTGGKTLQASSVIVSDADAITGVASLDVTGNITVGGTVDGVDLAAHAGAGGAVHADVIAGGAAGFMTGADKTKLDGIAASAAAVSGATPADVAAAGSAGVGTSAARSDHVHAHGTQLGGTTHAAASRTASGFMTTAQLGQLADDLPNVEELSANVGGVLAESDDRCYPELIWQLTPGRWRAGSSTAGFEQPFFYAETATGDFANGGTCELHCVVGVPTSGSAATNWPAAEDVGGYLISQHWDGGFIIPPGAMMAGAVLDLHLFGRHLVGAARNWTVILDPDPDVLHATTGNNGAPFANRDCVLGQTHGVLFGTPADLEDSGDDVLALRYTAHGLAEDAIVRITKGDPIIVGADGIVGDAANYVATELYVVTARPVNSVSSFSGTRDVEASAFTCLSVGDTVDITNATTSGLTVGAYPITAKVSATRVTLGALPGTASASVSNLETFVSSNDIFWLSTVDTLDVGWPTFVQWGASAGASSLTNVSTTSGTRDLTSASFATAVVGQLYEITDATTSGLTLGVYEITDKPSANVITLSDLPGTASSSVSNTAGDLYLDWSRKAFVTTNVSKGSHKRVAFQFTLSTLTAASTWSAFHLHIRIVSDSAGQNEDLTGAQYFAKLTRFTDHENIGPVAQTQPAAQGDDPVRWPSLRISRSYPGVGYSGSGTTGSAAYLFQGKTNYDGAGTVAYITSAHDLSGLYSEIALDVDIAPTGNQIMRSFKSDYSDATVTMLKVGGAIVAEVLDYYSSRRMMRVRDLSADTRIRAGDTVTWELYRKISGTWNTTPHSSGTFTAGHVRVAPLPIEMGLRHVMSGAQDGTTIAEINAGYATITRRKSV